MTDKVSLFSSLGPALFLAHFLNHHYEFDAYLSSSMLLPYLNFLSYNRKKIKRNVENVLSENVYVRRAFLKLH